MSPKQLNQWKKAVTSANSIAAIEKWVTSVSTKSPDDWETIISLYQNGVLHRLNTAALRALDTSSKEFQTLIKPNWDIWKALAKR